MRIPRSDDPAVLKAKSRLQTFFRRKRTPYYTTQLEVLLEGETFHWITHRAIRQLVQEGTFTELRTTTKYGAPLVFVLPSAAFNAKSHNMIMTHVRSKTALVERMSAPAFTNLLGKHLQALVKAELRANGLTIEAENSNAYQGRKWTETDHNLDYIASHPTGLSLGVEVKNTLPYISRDELDIKLDICAYLDIRPVFAVRMMPKHYMNVIYGKSGFGWIFARQAYPLSFERLAALISKRLELPVQVMTELSPRPQQLFGDWIAKLIT